MVSVNLYKKQLSHGIKIELSTQVVTVIYILEKRFFAVATFDNLSLFSSDSVTKLGLYVSSFDFQNNYCL